MDNTKQVRTSNTKARALVQSKQAFKGSNTFGVYNTLNCYVVYSYGRHFPMYACINGQWYENTDRYSVSTSKQQSQLHPLFDNMKSVNTQELKKLIAKQE